MSRERIVDRGLVVRVILGLVGGIVVGALLMSALSTLHRPHLAMAREPVRQATLGLLSSQPIVPTSEQIAIALTQGCAPGNTGTAGFEWASGKSLYIHC